jgi:hypothetical protein
VAGQWNSEVPVQTRPQQAGTTVVIGVRVPPVVAVGVRVVVLLHWYWDSAQGESQVEPMWQQPPLEVSLGSMMQLEGEGEGLVDRRDDGMAHETPEKDVLVSVGAADAGARGSDLVACAMSVHVLCEGRVTGPRTWVRP